MNESKKYDINIKLDTFEVTGLEEIRDIIDDKLMQLEELHGRAVGIRIECIQTLIDKHIKILTNARNAISLILAEVEGYDYDATEDDS